MVLSIIPADNRRPSNNIIFFHSLVGWILHATVWQKWKQHDFLSKITWIYSSNGAFKRVCMCHIFVSFLLPVLSHTCSLFRLCTGTLKNCYCDTMLCNNQTFSHSAPKQSNPLWQRKHSHPHLFWQNPLLLMHTEADTQVVRGFVPPSYAWLIRGILISQIWVGSSVC